MTDTKSSGCKPILLLERECVYISDKLLCLSYNSHFHISTTNLLTNVYLPWPPTAPWASSSSSNSRRISMSPAEVLPLNNRTKRKLKLMKMFSTSHFFYETFCSHCTNSYWIDLIRRTFFNTFLVISLRLVHLTSFPK